MLLKTTVKKRILSQLTSLLILSVWAIKGITYADDPITLTPVGTYETGIFDEGASEIVDYDPVTQRIFVVNADAGVIDVLDASDPTNPTKIAAVEQPGSVNSVAVKNGIVATAVENEDVTLPGSIVFHDTDGNVLSTVTAGVLPDNIVFSPDGLKVLTANEGQPNDDYTVDPEGSVTIVDLGDGSIASVSALNNDNVTQVTFEGFNDKLYSLLNKGVRIFGPGATVAQDLEPEYIAMSADSAYAFVSLQENNAIAVIDCAAGEAIDILPLGYKDHSSGQPHLDQYTFTVPNLPVLGTSTADDFTPILLGGFSGLWYAADESDDETKVFYTVPDRGPNGDAFSVDGVTNRQFLLPDYQAQIVRIYLDVATGELTVDEQILLTREDGETTVPITGIPNIPGFDEKPIDGKSNDIAYDPYGGDMEGIVKHPNGTFYTVDEYRPAIYHFFADGTLNARYVPEGTSLLGDTAQPEGYYGMETLPAEYANRRANRGFEAVALDPDKNVVYAFIQTPMYNPDNSTRNASDVIRILGVDADTGVPVEEYIYLLERNADSGFGFARTDKIGDAVYAGGGKFYVLERDSSNPSQPKIGHKYIFEIDITYATNLQGEGVPTPVEGMTWEQHSADDLAAQEVVPVWKEKVLNLPTIGYLPSDKPEGIALLEDGSLAVSNDNDFTQAGFPDLTLGIIQFSDNNAMDASNRDDAINITNWPTLGMYMPDTIVAYDYDGITYIVTANEGDSRDYDGYSEEERVADLTLDETVFPNAEWLQADENLGRIKTTSANGDIDGDGDFDRIFTYGARSFSIWDQYGNLVFDSGDDLEQITALYDPENFNSTNDENDSFDNRSDDKGPEPEGLAIGSFGGNTYLFLGLERVGGIVVYDITHPQHPAFMFFINNRDFDGVAEEFTAGDLGPEGLKFLPAEGTSTRTPWLLVGNEVSGTTTIYDLGTMLIPAADDYEFDGATSDAISFAWGEEIHEGETVIVERQDENGNWTQVAELTSVDPTGSDAGLSPDSNYTYRFFLNKGGLYSAIGEEIEISTQDFTGFYFGLLDAEAGSFGAWLTDDQTATVVVHLYGSDSVFSVEEVPVADNGTFSVETESGDIITGTIGYGNAEPVDAKGAVRDGHLGDDPYLSIAVNGSEATGTTFASQGETNLDMSQIGYFEGLIGSSSSTGLHIGLNAPTGEAYALIMYDGGTTESGIGTIDENGNIDITTNLGTVLTGSFNEETNFFTGTYAKQDGEEGSFNFLNPDDTPIEFSEDRLINISTRLFTGTDANRAIAGFVIDGDAPKSILITAKGWDLRNQGFENFLLDGILDLYRGDEMIGSSDDWVDEANADLIEATGVAPAGFYDPAMMVVLEPGAYTAIVSPKLDIDQGIAVVEVYEVNNGVIDQASQLINISTRGEVGTDASRMIGGFVVNGSDAQKIYVRSTGPSLDIPGANLLQDPKVSIRDADGTEIASNDNWRDATNVADIEATGIPPANEAEAGIVVSLDPGIYTVIVEGADSGTGLATVEIYKFED